MPLLVKAKQVMSPKGYLHGATGQWGR